MLELHIRAYDTDEVIARGVSKDHSSTREYLYYLYPLRVGLSTSAYNSSMFGTLPYMPNYHNSTDISSYTDTTHNRRVLSSVRLIMDLSNE